MKWLPIESAPNSDVVVLFCDERGNRWTDVAYDKSEACTGHKPIYWMPLPEPPEGE